MAFKIVADSSADLLSFSGVDFASVPLTIMAGERTFVDDAALDPREMLDYLATYKGRSTTACPNPDAWREAFGEADEVVCVTITSNLSGSCNAAMIAREDYLRLHPDRKVLVVDSLSTGPEMVLLIEQIAEWHQAGYTFEAIEREIAGYHKTTHLTFALESLRSLVNNGRVSPAVAALAGLLNIRIVGIASDVGTLQPVSKCRGEKRTQQGLINVMKDHGFKGGKVRIAHNNPALTEIMTGLIREVAPTADIQSYQARGLVSFYAEDGGILIGYEG
ncbi:MAG: DegV family protein [Clostridiales bacterium]|nr:DegV family protein [Clostridiales bacterium]